MSQWVRVLAVLVRTSEDYEWVAAKWWETIYDDSSVEENLNLLLRLARVETNVDSNDKGRRILEGLLQRSKDAGGFCSDSWQ